MNKIVFLCVFSFVLADAAFAQAYSVAPIEGTLAKQQDGQCRGHITYAIASTDADIAGAVSVETGQLEIRAACVRLDNLVSAETYDSKAGKLDIAVMSARVAVLFIDPDGPPVDKNGDGDFLDEGEANPRQAGECDLTITAQVRPADPTLSRVFRPREIVRVRPAPQCAPLTNIITNSCIVASGSWPVDVPVPAIPACP